MERVADLVGILVNGSFSVQGTVDELRSRIKRIRLVLPNGKLPANVPAEAVFQRLVSRDWTVTVDPFSDGLFEQLQHQLPWIQLCGDKTASSECNNALMEQFGIQAVPTTLLLDANGRVVAMGVRPMAGDSIAI